VFHSDVTGSVSNVASTVEVCGSMTFQSTIPVARVSVDKVL